LQYQKAECHLEKTRGFLTFTAAFALAWSNSLIGTTDIANWLLENTLCFIFVGLLIITYKKHQFSDP